MALSNKRKKREEAKIEKSAGKVFIGTAGYTYPEWRKGVFYPLSLPQKQEFAHYASKFSSLEINNTFYKLPSESVWKSWNERAPPGFTYSVKMNQWFSHRKRLLDPSTSWSKFYEGASELGEHLGPILIQLPGNFKLNPVNLQRLEDLSTVLPKKLRFAFEFRDESWFKSSVYDILRANNWALVMLPLGKAFPLPCVEEITADFTYIRWHGSTGTYRGSYSDQHLTSWANKIREMTSKGLDVYGYFNNTDEKASAAKDALRLQNLVQEDETETGKATKKQKIGNLKSK